jgi:hypothetical protein
MTALPRRPLPDADAWHFSARKGNSVLSRLLPPRQVDFAGKSVCRTQAAEKSLSRRPPGPFASLVGKLAACCVLVAGAALNP